MSDEAAKLLSIYLNDHYLAANGGLALARRIAKVHKDTCPARKCGPLVRRRRGTR